MAYRYSVCVLGERDQTHLYLLAQDNNKDIKPKQLTHEQATHKRSIFNGSQLLDIQTYKPVNE